MEKFKKFKKQQSKTTKTQIGQLFNQSRQSLSNMKMDFKSIDFKKMPLYFWVLSAICIGLIIWFIIYGI